MKNLLIYISPDKSFNNKNWNGEMELLSKIQIDNSLSLGWKKEDILAVTNFPYEYRGVKAIEVPDDTFCDFSPTASKINVILYLFSEGIIGDDVYFFHDWDAFQLENFQFDLDNRKIALTDYGITTMRECENRRWSTGTIFFRNGSRDVFEWVREAVYKYRGNEEVSLLALTRHNKHRILERIEKINITYNFATRRRRIGETYKIADKPLLVLHFHPFDTRDVYFNEKGYNNVEVCLKGKNPMNRVLVPDRLLSIFKEHGVY